MEPESAGTEVAQAPLETDPVSGTESQATPYTEGEGQETPRHLPASFWNTLLLVVSVASTAALLVMILILLRRKANKDEDLLL